MNKWYMEKGEQAEVVLSTRVRLARNINDFVFPSRLDINGKNKVNELVKSTVLTNLTDYNYIEMKDLNRLQAVSLAERRIISPEFASRNEGTALILSEDESVSIMLNEEDHIHLQVMRPGLALEEAYKLADDIDTLLDDNLNYAFDEKIGYLTALPTNLGTAMRASVILHLPALTATNQIASLANNISKLGLSITGAYGNRRQPAGDIYQISNQITLGITEETAIANLKSIVMQLVAREKAVAEKEIAKPSTEDKIYRSLGLLQNVRLINSNEFMQLISNVRFGAANGLIEIPIEKINGLIVDMQPATITVTYDDINTIDDRDARRAEIIRETLR